MLPVFRGLKSGQEKQIVRKKKKGIILKMLIKELCTEVTFSTVRFWCTCSMCMPNSSPSPCACFVPEDTEQTSNGNPRAQVGVY